jgi:ATP-dependent Lon protease
VRKNTAMTSEITLRRKGATRAELKKKILAAKEQNKEIILCHENKKLMSMN